MASEAELDFIEKLIRDPDYGDLEFENFGVNNAYSTKYSNVPHEIKDIYTNDSCIICSEKFEDDDETTVLTCNHLFHQSCYKQWGKSCPICRRDVNGVFNLEGLPKLYETVFKKLEDAVNFRRNEFLTKFPDPKFSDIERYADKFSDDIVIQNVQNKKLRAMRRLFSWTVDKMLVEVRRRRKLDFMKWYSQEKDLYIYASRHRNEIVGVESGADVDDAVEVLEKWSKKAMQTGSHFDAKTKLPKIRLKRYALALRE